MQKRTNQPTESTPARSKQMAKQSLKFELVCLLSCLFVYQLTQLSNSARHGYVDVRRSPFYPNNYATPIVLATFTTTTTSTVHHHNNRQSSSLLSKIWMLSAIQPSKAMLSRPTDNSDSDSNSNSNRNNNNNNQQSYRAEDKRPSRHHRNSQLACWRVKLASCLFLSPSIRWSVSFHRQHQPLVDSTAGRVVASIKLKSESNKQCCQLHTILYFIGNFHCFFSFVSLLYTKLTGQVGQFILVCSIFLFKAVAAYYQIQYHVNSTFR